MLHFIWLPSFFGLRQAHLHYFQRCKTSIEELLFKVLNEKTHVEKTVYYIEVFAKCGSPPLAFKKLQTPLETHLLTTIDPGVWELQANAAPTWGRRPRKPMNYVAGNLRSI